MGRKNNLRWGFFSVLAVLWLTLPGAYAQTAPVVKASKIRDFGRISFEWPREVRLKAGTNGNQLRITFEQSAKVDPAPILRGLRPYITNVQQSADGKTLTLTTSQAYQIRSFVSSNVSGIDILRLNEKPAETALNDKPQEAKPVEPPAEKPRPEPKPVEKPKEKPAAKKPVEKKPEAKSAPKPVEKKLPPVVAKKEEPKPSAPKPLMKEPEKPKTPVVEPKSEPKPEPKPEPIPEPKVEKAKPAPVPEPAPASKEPAKPAPAAAKEAVEKPMEPAAPKPAEEVKPEAPKEEAPPAPETPAEASPQPEAPAEAEPAPEKAPEEPAAEEQGPLPADAITDAPIEAAVAPEPVAEMPAVTVPGSVITATAESKKDGIVLHFPFTQRVAVTALRRGNRDYLYFSDPSEINLEAVKAVTGIDSAEVAPLANGMLVTLQTARPGLIADKAKDEYTWNFILTALPTPPAHPVRAIPQTDPPLKPHLLLQVLETLDGVNFDDPAAGDSLVLVPSYHAGAGIFPPREFVEFDMPATAQGIVIRPKTDNLRVARLREGMKITAPEGLTLSKGLPAVVAADINNTIDGDGNFFPYAQWKTPDGKESYHFANEIMGEIPLAGGMQKQGFRLRLAQLNLAEEKPLEALSLLDLIRREAPEFYAQNKLSALHGAANFLINRMPEAAADFADESLSDIPEMELWRDTLSILTTGEGKANYLDYYKNFISKYPPYIATRLAIVDADMLIERNQHNRALRIYETLTPSQLRPSQKGYVNYQMGKISAATGQKKQAEKIWGDLSRNPDNFIRSRASFALTNFELREAKIDVPEAIKRLEPLRITWRGDDFELGLLRFIGDLYEANQQPRESLRAYREIIQFFPDNPDNLQLLGKMADMFIGLFNGGAADKMTPLEALALYYEFRDLTPIGEDGDKMVRNLADRLVQVDLLDRAAALLEHQIRYRLAGEERSRVGAQLALIDLLNRKPKEALQVLELTGYGQNPEALQHSRAMLTARALADVGESARALKLLEDDDTPEAGSLRIGIHWDKKDWKNVIATGEAIMGQRKDPTSPISAEESAVLLKLAISYIFEHQTEQVQYLRDYFLPLMKDNPNEHLFDFITRNAPVDYRNLAQLTRHLTEVESFLTTYRKKMQEKGISKAIP